MSATTNDDHRLLDVLDGPKIGIAVLILALFLVSLFSLKLYSDLTETVERLDGVVEARIEEAKAADRRQVESCFSSAAQGPALRRVLNAIEQETVNPQARQDLRDFRRLNALNTPTVRECRQLAERLNVQPPGGTGG